MIPIVILSLLSVMCWLLFMALLLLLMFFLITKQLIPFSFASQVENISNRHTWFVSMVILLNSLFTYFLFNQFNRIVHWYGSKYVLTLGLSSGFVSGLLVAFLLHLFIKWQVKGFKNETPH